MMLFLLSGCLLLSPAPDAVEAFLEPGEARMAAAGSDGACAIFESGVIRCSNASLSPPVGDFDVIDMDGGVCAIDDDDELHCFGGFADPPSGEFTQLSMASGTACAIDGEDRRVECWGDEADDRHDVPDQTSFDDVAVGERAVCAVHSGALSCWGKADSDVVEDRLASFDYAAVALAADTGCAINEHSSRIECWGDEGDGRTESPAGEYRAISGGQDHFCALDFDGQAFCWGDNEHGQSTPPDGAFVSIDAGRASTCAVDEDGVVVCWGGAEGVDLGVEG